MKKAFEWLETHAVSYRFHDYKKLGIDAQTLAGWASRVGWQALLNTRGTSWRALSETQRSDIDETRALALMQANPSLIKRPILLTGDEILLGFDAQQYASKLEKSA